MSPLPTIFDSSDGGMSSRKFLYAIGTSILIFVGALISAHWPSFGPYYGTMSTALIGVLVAYIGGNVTNKLVMGKQAQVAQKDEP